MTYFRLFSPMFVTALIVSGSALGSERILNCQSKVSKNQLTSIQIDRDGFPYIYSYTVAGSVIDVKSKETVASAVFLEASGFDFEPQNGGILTAEGLSLTASKASNAMLYATIYMDGLLPDKIDVYCWVPKSYFDHFDAVKILDKKLELAQSVDLRHTAQINKFLELQIRYHENHEDLVFYTDNKQHPCVYVTNRLNEVVCDMHYVQDRWNGTMTVHFATKKGRLTASLLAYASGHY